ncbi:MAG: PepSY domain-containing protein [Firmicutes bacterium]|nr:PepSY domain-containing protein [Bacillota bacterium]
MKKYVFIALAIAAVLMLSAGCVYATVQIARVNAICEENALMLACVDAGILSEDAEVIRIGFEYKKGVFVYDIAFAANGLRYEYTVHSSNGMILEAEREEPAEMRQPADTSERPAEPSEKRAKQSAPSGSKAQSADAIGIDRAGEIALEAAGLSADRVVFSKAKLKRDEGRMIYDIEFYVTGEREYEYEIDAYTGEILDEDIEPWDDD